MTGQEEVLTKAIALLTRSLASLQAYTEICLSVLEYTELNAVQAATVRKLRKELVRSQAEFLETFGGWLPPGGN
jgi:hypothetical protein